MSNFIRELKIKKVQHLENIDIKLGDEKKHLILTGKNGCGKTSVLESLNKFFIYLQLDNKKNSKIEYRHKRLKAFKQHKKCYPVLVGNNSNYIYAFCKASREYKSDKPVGVNKINFSENSVKKINQVFLQYIVNLKAEKSFARDDNDFEVADKIDTWFNEFEGMLRQVFSDNSLKLVFDRKDYNFIIHRDNREPFDFNGLSAGYSAIIDIVTELILKIENTESKSFDCEGIVLIDEVENHLHVELQKSILPLLTSFFPNIQFIVTTHSPFVLQSIENSIVYDLERKEQLSGEKLKNASYSDIVKNYFEVDSEFSQVLEDEIDRYEKLVEIFDEENLTIEDEKELLALDIKLDKIAQMLSDSIYLRFKESQDRIKENG